MNTNKTIVMLNPKTLYPHPNNPRMQLGDISELTDSISQFGVLQNLTVVPYNQNDHSSLTVDDPSEAYVIIIGHRRHAGALQANLSAVPCVIETDMDIKQQVETMLIENKNREDLTVYEEAMGYQFLLDLGQTVEQIAKDTGFCEKTVRSRVKLLDLDKDKFAAAVERGGTLSDYAALDKIKNVERKNQVLEAIGTNNFQNALKRAIDDEKAENLLADALPKVRAFAIEKADVAKAEGFNYKFCYGYHYGTKTVEPPKDADTVQYYFYTVSGNINMYVEANRAENEERVRQEEDVNRRKAGLQAAANRSYELRKEFIMNYTCAKAKKNFKLISSHFALAAISKNNSYYGERIGAKTVSSLLEIPYNEESKSYDVTDFQNAFVDQPELCLLRLGYGLVESSAYHYHYERWDTKKRQYLVEYHPSDELDKLYAYLISLGYQMSDEELQLQNGSHPLFIDPFAKTEEPEENTDAA